MVNVVVQPLNQKPGLVYTTVSNGTQSTTVIHSAADADGDPLTVLVNTPAIAGTGSVLVEGDAESIVNGQGMTITILTGTNGGGGLGIEVKDTYGGSQYYYFNYFAAVASA